MTSPPPLPPPSPSDTRWVWSVRITVLASALLVTSHLILRLILVQPNWPGPFLRLSVVSGLMALAPLLPILWLLAKGVHRKWGLSLAIAWGVMGLVIRIWPYLQSVSARLINRLGRGNMAYSYYVQAGPGIWYERFAVALQLTLVVVAIGAFYTMRRQLAGRSALLWSFVVVILYWAATRSVLLVMLHAAISPARAR